MTIQNLADNFRQQIEQNKVVVLNKITLQNSGAANIDQLMNDLENYLGLNGQSLSLNGLIKDDIVVNGNDLIITSQDKPDFKGQTSFLNTTTNINQIKFSLDDTNKILDLLLDSKITQLDWSPAISFPDFGDFPMFKKDETTPSPLQNPTFIFASLYIPPSHILPYLIENKTFTLKQFLNFYSDFDTSLADLGFIVSFFNQFDGGNHNNKPSLFGTIDIYNQKKGLFGNLPNVDLSADLSDATFEIFGFLKVSHPHLKVTVMDVESDMDPAYADVTAATYFVMDVEVDGKDSKTLPLQLELSAMLFGRNGSFLALQISDNPGSATLAHIFNLMAGNSWNLPEQLQSFLNEIELKEFSATMFMGSDGKNFNLSSLMVKVGLNDNAPIELVEPFKNFTCDVVWTILNPQDTNGNRIDLMHYDGVVNMEDPLGSFEVNIYNE